MKFLITFVSAVLSVVSAASGESFFNPWSINIKLQCKRGDTLANAVEAARKLAQEAPLASGSEYFRNTTVRFSEDTLWAKEIVFQTDIEYEGKIGPLLYSLFSDHGLGFNFIDLKKIDGAEITVSRLNPTNDFAVFFVIPAEWKDIITEKGLGAVIGRLRIPAESIKEMTVSKQLEMACVRGNARACVRLWVYANDAIPFAKTNRETDAILPKK